MDIHTTTIACMAKKRKDRHRNPPINLRIPVEIDAKLRERAKKTRRTITAELIIALEKHLGDEEAKQE